MKNKVYIRIFLIINLFVVSIGSTLAISPNQSMQELTIPNQTMIQQAIHIDKSSTKYFILSQQQWSIPKNVQSILNMSALRVVMPRLLGNEKQKLVIRYPGGEVGILWASELKGWLVSLGVASERIELQTGSLKPDELQLFVN